MYAQFDATHYLLEPSKRLAKKVMSTFRGYDALSKSGSLRFIDGVADMYERSTRSIKKPEFNIDKVLIDGVETAVHQTTVMKKPFGNLVRFTKENQEKQPKVLIIAPISGHFATLLRDTVKRMIPKHEVYITDWISAKDVHISAGHFGLDEYLSYLIDFMHKIGPNTHVMAVCQPAVQVMALGAIMNEDNDPCMPASIIPMGGPIDPRVKKTQVNELAESHSLKWFESKFLSYVPEGHVGAGRRVYPGFVQLTAFLNMNPDSHYKAHIQFLDDKITNNVAGIKKHSEFYDEYLSVLDMDDVYFLETIEKIFQTYELPRGKMKYKGRLISLGAITKCPLLTIEGEKDDISAPGQSYAAHALCTNLPGEMHDNYLQLGVGHYGIFSGSKWRAHVAPKIESFIAKFDKEIGTFWKANKK